VAGQIVEYRKICEQSLGASPGLKPAVAVQLNGALGPSVVGGDELLDFADQLPLMLEDVAAAIARWR